MYGLATHSSVGWQCCSVVGSMPVNIVRFVHTVGASVIQSPHSMPLLPAAALEAAQPRHGLWSLVGWCIWRVTWCHAQVSRGQSIWFTWSSEHARFALTDEFIRSQRCVVYIFVTKRSEISLTLFIFIRSFLFVRCAITRVFGQLTTRSIICLKSFWTKKNSKMCVRACEYLHKVTFTLKCRCVNGWQWGADVLRLFHIGQT